MSNPWRNALTTRICFGAYWSHFKMRFYLDERIERYCCMHHVNILHLASKFLYYVNVSNGERKKKRIRRKKFNFFFTFLSILQFWTPNNRDLRQLNKIKRLSKALNMRRVKSSHESVSWQLTEYFLNKSKKAPLGREDLWTTFSRLFGKANSFLRPSGEQFDT